MSETSNALGKGPLEPEAWLAAAREFRTPLALLTEAGTGRLGLGPLDDAPPAGWRASGVLPAIYPEWLGGPSFNEAHGTRFPYVAGAMANGIATAELVIAMAERGMLAFFGAAGLMPHRVEAALDTIEAALGDAHPFGANLISSPNEPHLERDVAALYLARGVRRVSASAYVDLSLPLVRYAVSGTHLGAEGEVVRRNHVFAKVSRPEVARRFLGPPPAAMLETLAREGSITEEEARLAARLPLASDVTVEADSGGHTDNQSLTSVFPVVRRLASELASEHGYAELPRVGAAGGIGTPAAVAAAFALGADFVLTGSINQSAVESGLSEAGRRLLAEASMGDVMMAPAADMFEQGVKVQVLRRGTLFGPRASRLFEVYRAHDALESIDGPTRERLEREIFAAPLDAVWAETEAFFQERDPEEIERARREPKHRMALVFRWYLGLSSRWAIVGDPKRRLDYQIWCGPAMGAFNDWARGSFLEDPAERTVTQIALNLLEGAAVLTRAAQLRAFGLPIPAGAIGYRPRRLRLQPLREPAPLPAFLRP